jgi:hypothetical protein
MLKQIIAILSVVSLSVVAMPQQVVIVAKHAAGAAASAPVYQTASTSVGSTQNCNPGEPSGTAQGNVLVGGTVVAYTAPGDAPTLPSGWSSLYSGTSASNKFYWVVGYIVRGSSAASTTFTNINGSYRECWIMRISGANSSPIDSQSSSGSTSATQSTPTPPPTTATSACNTSLCLAIAGGVHWQGSDVGGWALSGYTVRSDNAATNDWFAATKDTAVSAGTLTPPQSTTNGSNLIQSDDMWNGFTITLKP